MFCEINVQSAAHITLIHNPRPTIYLFISFSIFLTDPRSSIPDPRSPIPYPRSSILDPRFPVNLEVLLIKMVLFFFLPLNLSLFPKKFVNRPVQEKLHMRFLFYGYAVPQVDCVIVKYKGIRINTSVAHT